jgi:hypothetical protein
MVATRRFADRLSRLFAVAALSFSIMQSTLAEPIKEGEWVELLFVQSATSGSFDGKTLTLHHVGPTAFFTDRPQRVAGHVRTSHFLKMWDEGNNSFEIDPPNANIAIFSGETPDNVVIELGQPKLEGTTLSYPIKVLRGKLPHRFEEASMVIDILGRWAAAAGGAMIGGAIGRREGFAAGAAYASPNYAYTTAPPAPCECNCN